MRVDETYTPRGEEDEVTSHNKIYKKPHRYEQIPLDTYASTGTVYTNYYLCDVNI